MSRKFVCPNDFCLFENPDWSVWAAHVRTHDRIPCSVLGCSSTFREQRVFRFHFVSCHTEDGRYKCSACNKVYKTKPNAVKHCKVACKKGGQAVPADDVALVEEEAAVSEDEVVPDVPLPEALPVAPVARFDVHVLPSVSGMYLICLFFHFICLFYRYAFIFYRYV